MHGLTSPAALLLCQAADEGSKQQQQQAAVPPVFSVKRGHPSAHRYQVTCLAWYPVDTGLFVTGSADQEVKVVMQPDN